MTIEYVVISETEETADVDFVDSETKMISMPQFN